MSILIRAWRCRSMDVTIVFCVQETTAGELKKNESVVEYARKNERHPDCPLVPVPDHGRLIDVKSLENMHFTECMYDAESKLFVPFVEVASAIFAAPIIIPAEEEMK